MNSAIGMRLTTAMILSMSWSVPTGAQEMALPTARTAANGAAPVAAAGAILDPAQAANWALRNRIALSIAAVGTEWQDNAAPQAQPSPEGAPARPIARPPAKARKRWTPLRIGVVAVGLGLTGTGAYLAATGSMVFLPHGSGAPCTVQWPCTPVWDGRKKAGVWMMGFGVPLTLAGLFAQ